VLKVPTFSCKVKLSDCDDLIYQIFNILKSNRQTEPNTMLF